jgi:uncharacterized protein (DUF2336 family)
MANLNLEGMEVLAKVKTKKSRKDLLDRVVDIRLVRNEKMRDREKEILDDILVDLVSHAEMDLRKQLADQLMDHPDPPDALIDFLVHDVQEVAAPMLRNCNAVSTDSLLKVVRTESEGHRVAIAGRADISAEVSGALIDIGEDIVLTTLIENETAEIDYSGMKSLVERSRNIEVLRRPLLEREGLDPIFANQMFWWVSGPLRERILSEFPVDEDVLDRAMELAVTASARSSEVDPKYNKPNDVIKRATAVRVNDLVSMLRSGDLKGLVSRLITDLGVNGYTVKEALTDEGGQALALLCKVIGADRGQFTTMFLLIDYQRSKTPRPAGDLQFIASIFDNVTEEQAVNTLCFWDLDDLMVA